MNDESDSEDFSTRRIEDGNAFNATTSWIMATLTAVAAVAIVWYFALPLNFDFNDPAFNPAVFVPVILALASLWYLFGGVKGSLLGGKFGKSVLEMKGRRLLPGQTLEGVIRTAREVRPTGDYTLHFQCIETVKTLGHGETRSKDHVRWEAKAKVDADTPSSTGGIPVHFFIPTSCRAIWDSGDPVRWILEIKAPLEGLDYYAIFAIPVWRESEIEFDPDEELDAAVEE